MKKIILLIGLMAWGLTAKAQVEFAYEAGAELVSAYLWRGMNCAGLSIQPTVSVGFDHEHVQFRCGVWASLGASDWKFTTGLPKDEGYNPNTYFVPEMDVMISLRSHGVTIGSTHLYYGSGPYFNVGDIDKAMEGSSQTDVMIGIDGDDWLGEAHHAYVNWYTLVGGADGNINDDITSDKLYKRAYSSYLEFGYDYTFTNIDLTLGAQLGIVPWRSDYVYATEKAAVQCVALKLNKAWVFEKCELDLFAQGMLCPHDMNKDNVYINLSGDDKVCQQKLNGTIGLGIWF